MAKDYADISKNEFELIGNFCDKLKKYSFREWKIEYSRNWISLDEAVRKQFFPKVIENWESEFDEGPILLEYDVFDIFLFYSFKRWSEESADSTYQLLIKNRDSNRKLCEVFSSLNRDCHAIPQIINLYNTVYREASVYAEQLKKEDIQRLAELIKTK